MSTIQQHLHSKVRLNSLLALLSNISKTPTVSKAQKAFLFTYAYVAVSRIIGDVTRGINKKESTLEILNRIKYSLLRSLESDKLPQLFVRLIVFYPLSEYVITRLFTAVMIPAHKLGKASRLVTIFTSGLVSSYYAHHLYIKAVIKRSPTLSIAKSRLENISSEVTALVLSRALDTIIRKILKSHAKVSQSTLRFYDAAQFTLSCFVIMFSWFFVPSKMQQKYRQWITKMANMDDDLVDALRYIRTKELIYGENGAHSSMLETISVKYGLPKESGNTAKTVPIPCRLVHANSFESCEKHALWRFYRGMKTASMVYLPLNIFLSLRQKEKLLPKILGIIKRTIRSSAFLASFIALNWYSVCLVRTRIGPKLFPNATAQQLDDTWGPALGSFLCGFSIMFEEVKRRTELALFVFAKATSILLPTDLGSNKMKLDSALFSISLATLITFAKSDPSAVSGFFGYFLQGMY
ncbi:uncharacterized protein SAPINGB_P000256 [Magnusiomyces paraingens]|uniref:Transmembrane protein 135 N-terminal domain-containing protein n=1 Tax=Magnusiomyces paraingens TaxID=2606893 RepID=A0A5E8AZ10_9ASCO|nr:uncharacterized protein SAPINGB_P000256 [Saprochaete ingens]VVT44008.1 unnamed protein product [Saprochaete ingens]